MLIDNNLGYLFELPAMHVISLEVCYFQDAFMMTVKIDQTN